MKNTFTINGRVYTAPEFTFNTLCDFEEAGISIQDAQKKPTSMIRMYFALLFDGDRETAGSELEKHMMSGGSLEEISTAMIKELENSRFFQALSKNSETEDQDGVTETESESESPTEH